MPLKYSAQDEQKLMTEIWQPAIAEDPYAFVMFAFPWGEKGTPLENDQGPREWQANYLKAMAEHIRVNKARVAEGKKPTVFKHATASGRGVGKSALVSWLVLWFLSTQIGSTTIITANTEPQLKSRTFAEVKKWLTLAINRHWFETSVMSVFPAKWFKELIESQLQVDTTYYYAQGQLWSEEDPDAFAGAHNPRGMQVLMDESSGIPNAIAKVTEGFFTEPVVHRYWHAFSNPRRGSGFFYDCFHNTDSEGRPFWRLLRLDSRTVEGLDTAVFDQMIEQNGIDSYTVRVEVLGEFPRQGDKQFIAGEAVRMAQTREVVPDPGAPLIMGVDVARYGDDWSVARFRQGNDARSIPPERWQNMDLQATADKVATLVERYRPDAVCIDSGMGAGVIDILRRRGFKIHEVAFGGGAHDKHYANRGTELYALARDWMPGGALDRDAKLFGDLTGRDYDFFGKAKDQVILVAKEAFKSEHGRSPDDGDAFVMTFAVKPARRDMRVGGARRTMVATGVDYPLFG